MSFLFIKTGEELSAEETSTEGTLEPEATEEPVAVEPEVTGEEVATEATSTEFALEPEGLEELAAEVAADEIEAESEEALSEGEEELIEVLEEEENPAAPSSKSENEVTED